VTVIGILSDAHGNFRAFNKAIELLNNLGASNFIFLGDALGYYPCTKIIDSISSLGSKIQCISGNHDKMIMEESFQTDLDSIYQHKIIYNNLKEKQKKLILSWGSSITIESNSGMLFFIHGSPSNNTSGYVYPDTDLTKFNVTEKYIFMGHTHRPFIRQTFGSMYINAGSCGMPRDHGTLGSAVLFNDHTGAARIIRFDIKKEFEKIEGDSLCRIHPSVLELQNRMPQTYVGEMVHG
jgi:putative phosphoesterase